LVIATPAYQTAYQLVRPGPIKQVLRRTLTALSAAAMRGRILADTEEVTGSNPVSPTKKALVSHPFCDLARACALGSVDLSAKLSAYRLASPSKSSLMARAPRVMSTGISCRSCPAVRPRFPGSSVPAQSVGRSGTEPTVRSSRPCPSLLLPSKDCRMSGLSHAWTAATRRRSSRKGHRFRLDVVLHVGLIRRVCQRGKIRSKRLFEPSMDELPNCRHLGDYRPAGGFFA
jgi:hypothetical protein